MAVFLVDDRLHCTLRTLFRHLQVLDVSAPTRNGGEGVLSLVGIHKITGHRRSGLLITTVRHTQPPRYLLGI